MNSAVVSSIRRGRLHLRDHTMACVLNMSLVFLFQLMLVVPSSLFILVVQNWVLGAVGCYVVPMVQVRDRQAPAGT